MQDRAMNEGLTEFSSSRREEHFCSCFYFEKGKEIETFRIQNEFVINSGCDLVKDMHPFPVLLTLEII